MYRLQKITLDGLAKSKIQFSAIPRHAIDEITDPDALSVYMYLMVKPPSWDIREPDIIEQRQLDKRRLAAALLKLRDLGYVFEDPEQRGVLIVSMISQQRLALMPEHYIDHWKPTRKAQPNDEPPF